MSLKVFQDIDILLRYRADYIQDEFKRYTERTGLITFRMRFIMMTLTMFVLIVMNIIRLLVAQGREVEIAKEFLLRIIYGSSGLLVSAVLYNWSQMGSG
jgi:hypothetical protein